jgi:peptidoglycan/xylan/chitin deacetylase (PgdA/CDA1 family)
MKAHHNLIVTTSWDDGQKSDIKLAKILSEYGIKGTFYITKSYGNPLENDEILKISRYHEIGAHTLNHPVLTEITKNEVENEIFGSKKYIENIIGITIPMFCYPKGVYNESIKKIVDEAGFIGARTCNPLMPRSNIFDYDPFELPVSLHASNGSPRLSFLLWKNYRLSLRALFDWELRSKELFDRLLQNGGVFHLWGHSWEIFKSEEFNKLKRVLQYISENDSVTYMTNGELLSNNLFNHKNMGLNKKSEGNRVP